MFRGEAQGLLQGLEPGVQGLPRQPIHQVQPQVGETRRPDQRQGRLGLPGRVAALQKPQFRLIEGLDPQAQAVNAQVAEERQLVRGNVVGVGFEGDFTVRGKREMPSQTGQQKFGKLRPRQERRCRPQKEGVEGGKLVPVEPGFGVQGGEIGGNQGIIGDGIKIAVGALGFAEGDVNVEAGFTASVLGGRCWRRGLLGVVGAGGWCCGGRWLVRGRGRRRCCCPGGGLWLRRGVVPPLRAVRPWGPALVVLRFPGS